MGSFRITEDGLFRGNVQFLDAVLNAGCVANTNVAVTAAIAASKLLHQHRQMYEQESDTTAIAEDRVVHIAVGAGTIIEFKTGVVVACIGDAEITVDLHINGVTCLTAAVVIDSGDAAYALVEGTISNGTLAAGDVVEVVVTVAADGGTLGKGLFAYADVDEAYQ